MLRLVMKPKEITGSTILIMWIGQNGMFSGWMREWCLRFIRIATISLLIMSSYPRFVTVEEFCEAFKHFHVGERLMAEVSTPFDKTKSHPAALMNKKYGVSRKEILKACQGS